MATKSQDELLIRINADLRELEKSLNEGERKTRRFGDNSIQSFKALGAAGGLTLAGLTTLAVKSLDAFKEFETGLVSVAKTTDLQGKELNRLRSEIVGLSKEIPVSTTELLNIAAAAGQLGVKGVDSLSTFTETIAKLNATTDLVGEEGAKSITRILNVTGEGIKGIEAFGAVLVDLGNNFATSESEIVRTASEVGRATSQFNLGSTNVAGLSAALSSLSIQAELGGSVVGKAFRTIDEEIRKGTGEAFNQIEKLTGLTGSTLRQTFETDATAVFRRFVEGLGDVAKSGGSVSATLELLGLKGDEVNKVLPVIAQRSELVGQALDRAGKAAADASALNDEAARAFDTTASRLQISQNKLDQLLVQVGEQIGPDIIDAVNDITTVILENKESIVALAEAFSTTVKVIAGGINFLQQGFKSLNVETLLAPFKKAAADEAEFIKQKLKERGVSEEEFQKKYTDIRKKGIFERSKAEQKGADEVVKIDIEKRKERERIEQASAAELKRIEAEKLQRIVELNENELRILRLQREGADEEIIRREEEKRQLLEDINRMSNDILEAESKTSLTAIEQESLNHTRRLLEINKAKLEDLERQQQEFGDDLVGIVQNTYNTIENIEPPDVTVPINTSGGGDTGGTGSGGGTSGGGDTGGTGSGGGTSGTPANDTPGGGSVILSLGEQKIDDNTYLAKARAKSGVCSGVEASRVDDLGRNWCVEGCRSNYQWDSKTLRTCRRKSTSTGEPEDENQPENEGMDYGQVDPEDVNVTGGGGQPGGTGGTPGTDPGGGGGGAPTLLPPATTPIIEIGKGLGLLSVATPNAMMIPDEESDQPTGEQFGDNTRQTQTVVAKVDLTLNQEAANLISAKQRENYDLGISKL